MQTRRTIITGALATFAARARAQEKADGEDFKVTLLGTGTPVPSLKRFGPSSLVQAGGETFMIDCGRGATQRLWQLGVRFSTVSSLFLTHLHSDHIVGIPDADSQALLARLWDHAEQPKYAWTHQWRVGDLVLWDNRCCMHFRSEVNSNYRRVMHRTVIKGEPVIPAW